METPFLLFKYLKNRQIHLGDGVMYDIPYTMGRRELSPGVPDPLCETMVPIFDYSKVHKVELLDETPDLPVKDEDISDELYKELSKDAWAEARDARKRNDNIRKAVKALFASGTIELVEDPFAVAKKKSFGEPKPVTPVTKEDQEPEVTQEDSKSSETTETPTKPEVKPKK